jgi:MFS family permease
MSPRVKKIILSHGLTGFICWYGVEKVFQKTIGISVFQVSLLAISYIAISALLNVPTGILSDRKGRRYAITLAAISLLLSTLVGGLSHNIWVYLISFLLWGLFYTTQNGSYQAILYDTLKEEGREKDYARYSGASVAAFWTAVFMSSVIGAWIGSHFNLRLAYFVTLIPNAFNIFLALSLHEPKRQKHDPSATSFSMARQGFKFLKSSPQVLQLTGTFLLVSMLSWTTNEFSQLFFIELGFGVLLVGVIGAFSGLLQAAGSFIAHRFKHVSIRLMTVLSMTVMFATFLVPVSYRYVAVAAFLGLVILRQVFYISNDATLQHSLPSSIRATTLSSVGMLNDGVLIVCYFLFGIVSEHRNVRTGYLVVGLCGLLIVGITYILSKRLKFNEPLMANYGTDKPLPETEIAPR